MFFFVKSYITVANYFRLIFPHFSVCVDTDSVGCNYHYRGISYVSGNLITLECYIRLTDECPRVRLPDLFFFLFFVHLAFDVSQNLRFGHFSSSWGNPSILSGVSLINFKPSSSYYVHLYLIARFLSNEHLLCFSSVAS